MLILAQRLDESITIEPSSNIPPEMTVAELFKNGLIRIKCSALYESAVKLSIQAPRTLKIMREELETA